MSATLLQPALPWSGPLPEDLRFRRILASVLVFFLLLGVSIPQLRVAPIETETPPDLPPRLAQIIAEPITSPMPVRLPASNQSAAPQSTALRQAPTQVPKEKVPPRQPADAPPAKRIENQGLLALSDALDSMQRSVPSIAAAPQSPAAAGGGDLKSGETRASLIAGITEGSRGIGVGMPSHEQILGKSELSSDSLARRRHTSIGDRADTQVPSGVLENGRGNLRTEEEIQAVLSRHKRTIYRLYNRELLTEPGLHGKLVARITISPSGRVTACDIVYSEIDARSFEQALTALLKQIDFGAKPGAPSITTRVPIEFFPT